MAEIMIMMIMKHCQWHCGADKAPTTQCGMRLGEVLVMWEGGVDQDGFTESSAMIMISLLRGARRLGIWRPLVWIG